MDDDVSECWCNILPEKPAWPFKIENITAAQAPLLKVYYWENFDIDGLNQKLESGIEEFDHDLFLPTRQVNSGQLKIVFWLRDLTTTGIDLRLKRIQNCECSLYQTRIGFNQFRQLYHCPHRRLINITQERIKTNPGELVALSMVAYFYFFGEHKLSFEVRFDDDKYLARLHFHVDIVGFDPQKCLITKELIPVDMTESRRFIQAIWVRNITMQDLKFNYCSKSRGIKVINHQLTVPRQSVWPLMVEYRPTDFTNELDLNQVFDNVRTTHKILAKGYVDSESPEPSVPIEDYDCGDFRYVIYPNQIEFQACPEEERSLMVCIHNYSQECKQFRWQNYVINNLFSIGYEPETFRLKPHHSKLCVVHMRGYDRPIHFKRIPLVLEVHKIFDRSTKIAKELLEEIESIDDPKWKEESYMEHVLLHLNIKVTFKPIPKVDIKCDMTIPTNAPWTFELPMLKSPTITIFEKLFWEHLAQSSFMRANTNPEISDELSYNEVLSLYANPISNPPSLDLSYNTVLKLVSLLIADAVREISKNWLFVPTDIHERPL